MESRGIPNILTTPRYCACSVGFDREEISVPSRSKLTILNKKENSGGQFRLEILLPPTHNEIVLTNDAVFTEWPLYTTAHVELLASGLAGHPHLRRATSQTRKPHQRSIPSHPQTTSECSRQRTVGCRHRRSRMPWSA